jgi:predicted DNA-binding ribbon-helix-helix protein
MKQSKARTPVSFRLSPALVQQMKELAAKKQLTVTELLRELVVKELVK